MPEFSIIIPVYNTKKWLNRCINSIQNQSISDFELLLIDDESTDGSLEICNQFAKEDARIKVLHGKHKGPAATRNIGIREAIGEYLLFIDSDDEVETHFLEYVHIAIGDDKPDICYYTMHYVVEANQTKVYQVLRDVEEVCYSSSDFLKKCVNQKRGIPSSTWLMAFRKDFQVESGIYMDEAMEWSEDADFSYHLFSKAQTIKAINHPAYYWHRDNGETLSNRISIERLSARMDHYIKWSKFYEDINNFPTSYDEIALKGFAEWLRDEYCNFLKQLGQMGDKKLERLFKNKLMGDRDFWEKSSREDIKIYRQCGLSVGTLYNQIERWKGKLIGKFRRNS